MLHRARPGSTSATSMPSPRISRRAAAAETRKVAEPEMAWRTTTGSRTSRPWME
jgi:hypothetical protein